MAAKYFVKDENTLGIIYEHSPRLLQVLHGSTIKGGHDWKNGPVSISEDRREVRPATREDFEAYRIAIPPDFTD